MMKKIFLILSFFAAVLQTLAASTEYCLAVWKTGNDKVTYNLRSKPVIRYDNGRFIVTTGAVTVSYAESDVEKFTMEEADEPAIPDDEGHDYYLVLWQTNGEQEIFNLHTRPTIQYRDGQFWVISTKVEIGYPEETVEMFTLTHDISTLPTPIDAVMPEPEPLGVTHSEARPGSPIKIFDAGGRMMATYTVDADGQLRYALSSLPAGVYIIKTESTTIKIIKK